MSQPLRDASNKATTPVSKLMRGMNDLSFQNKAPNSAGRNMVHNSFLNQSGFLNQTNNMKGGNKLTVRKREITPTRNPNFTSSNSMQGDRFIPTRMSDEQLESAHYSMKEKQDPTFNTSLSAPNSPVKDEAKEQMLRMMRGKSTGNLTDAQDDERILCYKKNSAPAAPVGHMSHAKVLYSAHNIIPSSSVKKSTRFISTSAERILDAPELMDDYYMNILDWSRNGLVAVALSYTLYIWNSESGDIHKLFELDGSNELQLPTAVKWSKDGKHLAVGFRDGTIKLYDPDRPPQPNGKIEIRTMRTPVQARAGCLAWRGANLSSGHQSGTIYHHDVRVQQHLTGSFTGHRQEVVGLQWNADEKFLASGSGDTTVRLWDAALCGENSSRHIYNWNDHVGSVRAVSFCNFKSSMLATGGGMEDKTIKMWNINSGDMIKSIPTESAVNSIAFNETYKEMISAHSCGNLFLWKYPNFRVTQTLNGHSPTRALTIVPSPCGQYIMSAGADETLKTWHCFKVDKSTTMVKSKQMGHTVR